MNNNGLVENCCKVLNEHRIGHVLEGQNGESTVVLMLEWIVEIPVPPTETSFFTAPFEIVYPPMPWSLGALGPWIRGVVELWRLGASYHSFKNPMMDILNSCCFFFLVCKSIKSAIL